MDSSLTHKTYYLIYQEIKGFSFLSKVCEDQFSFGRREELNSIKGFNKFLVVGIVVIGFIKHQLDSTYSKDFSIVSITPFVSQPLSILYL